MLAKKTIVCIAWFLAILIAGCILNARLSATQTADRHSSRNVTIYSSDSPTGSLDLHVPFGPREYVRIIRGTAGE